MERTCKCNYFGRIVKRKILFCNNLGEKQKRLLITTLNFFLTVLKCIQWKNVNNATLSSQRWAALLLWALSVCETTPIVKYLLTETHCSQRFTPLFFFLFQVWQSGSDLCFWGLLKNHCSCSLSLDDDPMVNSKAVKATPSTLVLNFAGR